MGNEISTELLGKLSELIGERMGLYFAPERRRDLERGIIAAAEAFGFRDGESCAEWLLSTPLAPNHIEILASHLTVGETYFFRDKEVFGVLEKKILPELIRSRREHGCWLKIWSAACATGEEPYSIAILLDKIIPDLRNWRVTILATDINPHALKKADKGIYSNWSFRNTPAWVKEQYFRKRENDRFEILPSIKRMVTFASLNIIEDLYPRHMVSAGAMDIIFCRNLLMYFAPENVRKVIQKLYNSLADNGWLIVGPSEASHVLFPEFTTFSFPGAILYRKEPEKSQTLKTQTVYTTPHTEAQLYSPPTPDHAPEPEPVFVAPPFEVQQPLVPQSEGHEVANSVAGRSESAPETVVVDGFYQEALELYAMGRNADVIDKLVPLLSQGQPDSEAIFLLARTYANEGKLAEAFEWCEKAIATDKLNPNCYYLLAHILEEQGRIEEAMQSLNRVLYLDQKFVLAHIALGNHALRKGEFKQAKKYFENALSLLSAYKQEEVLPEAEGITVGRLREVVTLMSRNM